MDYHRQINGRFAPADAQKDTRMPLRFTVLGSGSSGNASLLEADGFGLLIDAGLGPRQLAARLAEIGSSWTCIHAAILTHTHGDHWNERTLAFPHRRRLPLYCHPNHHDALSEWSDVFGLMHSGGLVRPYRHAETLIFATGLCCDPIAIRHDGGATFGFRFEGTAPDGTSWALAYLTDLGSWTAELAERLADVDVLALEFNHDVALQYASGRSPRLIARVLGDAGHLSNEQAADLVREILNRSGPGRLRHVVQLHLSQDCNRPELALMAARQSLEGCGHEVAVHASDQYRPGPSLVVEPRIVSCRRSQDARPRSVATESIQLWLPGWDPRPELLADEIA
jgi:ribonuclease BN (tRNA processing enzyme)